MEKIENIFHVNYMKIVVLFMFIVLVSNYVNTIKHKDFLITFEKKARDEVFELERVLENEKNVNRILSNSRLNEGNVILDLDQYISQKSNIKLVAISKYGESLYVNSQMKRILQSLKSEYDKMVVYYLTDYKTVLNFPATHIELATNRLKNLNSPQLFVLNENNQIHMSFRLHDQYDQQEYSFVRKNIAVLLNNIYAN